MDRARNGRIRVAGLLAYGLVNWPHRASQRTYLADVEFLLKELNSAKFNGHVCGRSFLNDVCDQGLNGNSQVMAWKRWVWRDLNGV